MAKLTAWLVTILGVWMALGLFVPALAPTTMASQWATALIVLIIGIGKLVRNYKKRR